MPVESSIRRLIEKKGHVKVDELMKEALSDNPFSYYRKYASIGDQGDFLTSPEISQLFGETICLWAIEEWRKLGKPSKISLIELGPGKGYLMRDFLKTAKLEPGFFEALQIFLVEINSDFVKEQQTNLKDFHKDIAWLEHIFNIKEGPAIFLANEFFDALPIKQYIKVKELWYEAILLIDPSDGKIKYDKIGMHKELAFQLKQDHPNAFDGAILEESIESLEIIRFICSHIKKFSGAGLVIDYGYYIDPLKRMRSEYIPSLQALKSHKYTPTLESLGEADISAHVDFYALKKACTESEIVPEKIISQAEFLIKYGILLRKESLSNKISKEEAEIISKQVERLISPNQMGNLFKVLRISSIAD